MEESLFSVYHREEGTWWWSEGRRALVTQLLRKYGNGQARPRILEIGCGTGGLLKELSQWSAAYGLDVSPKALEFCLERELDCVCLGDITSLPFRDEQFDAVVCVDVLEHVDDDGAALREVRRICKKGGRLVATVPAFQFLWSRRDVQLHHKRRYTLGQVKKRVREQGFRILKASYVNVLLFVPMLVMIRLGMLRSGGRLKLDYALVPGPVNRLLAALFRMESQLVSSTDLPIGTSIACVAVK
ncbi:MAG TPA: class I SAM-dependent methyltransferase [Dehalococcoidia bacterium]|nr:class I SAM-dependent methyltransferase [Dehalococcoidia bacterium]